MISRSTIDKVFEAARVEEVIGDFVHLKKSGANFKGLSPFTSERTPSFMVSPAKQIWKDFSSGKGGNAVSFLMEHEHYSYPEAIRYLAKKYGIEIEEVNQTEEERQAVSERESLYLINEYAKSFFQTQLLETNEGKAIGLSYFKERGFTEETIKTFDLGYSPEKWEAFTERAIKDGYDLERLEAVGLTIVRENRQFDRFRGRVMFPIKSMSGRTLGFGGRILSATAKAAKYLNSPESVVYDKSKILYGLFTAKQSIAREDMCYLVEGYTDVIQMYQRGITNVVSSSGTALTPDQVRLIRRLTQNITLLFDADDAGLRAALRGVDIILEEGMNVQVCVFPEGEDPDSFARKHSLDAIQEYFKNNTQDFISFKADILSRDISDNPAQRAEVIRDIVESIAKIPDPIKREIYIQTTAKQLKISERVLFNTLGQIQQVAERRANRTKTQEPKMEVVQKQESQIEAVDRQKILEYKILEILLLYGNNIEVFKELYSVLNDKGEFEEQTEEVRLKIHRKIYLALQEDETEFVNESFQTLYKKIIDEYNQKDSLNVQAMMGSLSEEETRIVSNILMTNEKHELHDWERNAVYVKKREDGLAQLTEETILNLRAFLLDKKLKEIAESLKSPEATDEEKQQNLSFIKSYLELKVLLAENLDRVV